MRYAVIVVCVCINIHIHTMDTALSFVGATVQSALSLVGMSTAQRKLREQRNEIGPVKDGVLREVYNQDGMLLGEIKIMQLGPKLPSNMVDDLNETLLLGDLIVTSADWQQNDGQLFGSIIAKTMPLSDCDYPSDKEACNTLS